jgi:hypothetical protein
MAYRSLGAFFNYVYGVLSGAQKMLHEFQVQHFADIPQASRHGLRALSELGAGLMWQSFRRWKATWLTWCVMERFLLLLKTLYKKAYLGSISKTDINVKFGNLPVFQENLPTDGAVMIIYAAPVNPQQG